MVIVFDIWPWDKNSVFEHIKKRRHQPPVWLERREHGEMLRLVLVSVTDTVCAAAHREQSPGVRLEIAGAAGARLLRQKICSV